MDGTTIKSYFFDSCALIDFVFGEKRISPYADSRLLTTPLNLLEFHYVCTKMKGERFTDTLFEEFLADTILIDPLLLPDASKFRLRNIKKQFSYIDCVGYIVAKHHGIPFLTSDSAFKGMENVEFVG